MQHLYISNRLQNKVNSPCEIVVECDGSDAATLYRLDAVTVEGHPVGAVRRTIEGDVTQRSNRRYAFIQPIEPDGKCRSRSGLLANGIAFGDRGLQGERTFAKHLVIVFSCRSCRTILARGPQTIYLFEGGVRGIIGGNRGCRGKRGKKGGKIGCFCNVTPLCADSRSRFVSCASLSSQSAL